VGRSEVAPRRIQFMKMKVPDALEALSSGSSATQTILAWWRKSKGDMRALTGELKDNLAYLDMVAEDEVDLGAVIEKISVVEYRRLAREGFNFNRLKKAKICSYPSLAGTDLASWAGKETEELVDAIYARINDLKIRYPHVRDNHKYRWKVRVNNIRKRIWLLLKHASS